VTPRLVESEAPGPEDPEAAIVAGENAAVIPAGIPPTVNEIGALNPLTSVAVICAEPVPPSITLTEAGALTVKLGPAWTVTFTVADFVTPPPVAVIVSMKDPTGVATAVDTFSVLDPEAEAPDPDPAAAIVAGENVAVIPAGMP
jgi:hypothetical protein